MEKRKNCPIIEVFSVRKNNFEKIIYCKCKKSDTIMKKNVIFAPKIMFTFS